MVRKFRQPTPWEEALVVFPKMRIGILTTSDGVASCMADSYDVRVRKRAFKTQTPIIYVWLILVGLSKCLNAWVTPTNWICDLFICTFKSGESILGSTFTHHKTGEKVYTHQANAFGARYISGSASYTPNGWIKHNLGAYHVMRAGWLRTYDLSIFFV